MPKLRNRSYGVYCQSYDELFQVIQPHRPPCFNIDQFLLQQQKQELHFCSQSNYFFNQADQMQQQEDEELAKPFQTPFEHILMTTEIAIICQQLQQVMQELINKQKIKMFYSARYINQTGYAEPISVQIKSNVVWIAGSKKNISQNKSFESQIQSQESTSADLEGGEAKLEERFRKDQTQSKSLQLVIYYNFVQQGHLKDRSNSSENAKMVFQHKMWLIQKHEEYPPLLASYIDIPHFLFRTKRQNKSKQVGSRIIYEQIQPPYSSDARQDSSCLPDGILKDVLNKVEGAKRQSKRLIHQ